MKPISAIACLLLVAGTAQSAEKTLDRTFTVSPGGALVVDADSASVKVSGGDTNTVTVHMVAHGSDSDLANMTLDASQKDNDVTVVMRRGKQGWFWHWSDGEGQIQVTVPRQIQIDVRTGGGSVELKDTSGSASLRTSGGEVTAKNVTGNVEARTSGGGILVDTLRGDIEANTSGGDVRLLNVDGKIRGETSGGSVRCSLVGSNRGIWASTSGGDIQLSLPKTTTADFEATTSGGEFSLELPVTATILKEGHVKGTINGGGQPIEVRTSGGNISVRAAN